VSGGGLSSKDILLTAIAGAIAGAVSMCAGEYVATKSQNEVMHSEIALESQHVQMYRDDELEELRQLLDVIGIPQGHTLHCDMMAFYKKHPDALLKIMTALEFGVVDAEERSPITAGFFSFALFMTGSLPSVLPFAFATVEPVTGLAWAAACTVICLLLVGGVKAWATRGNCFTAAMENLIIAGFGGVGAYCIGAFFDHLLH
jgi:VIT1/CCC1 family predicted Fe2+/Mn2+ transporter